MRSELQNGCLGNIHTQAAIVDSFMVNVITA